MRAPLLDGTPAPPDFAGRDQVYIVDFMQMHLPTDT
jgi:hypothetical protein